MDLTKEQVRTLLNVIADVIRVGGSHTKWLLLNHIPNETFRLIMRNKDLCRYFEPTQGRHGKYISCRLPEREGGYKALFGPNELTEREQQVFMRRFPGFWRSITHPSNQEEEEVS